MKQNFYLLLILLSVLGATNLTAQQALIDMTMSNVPAGSDKLEVRVRPTEDVNNENFSAVIFTVRFPSALGGALSVFSSPYGITLALVGSEGGFDYYAFQHANNNMVTWNQCEEYIAATLKYSNGPADGAFELITGVPWTNANNGTYYVELAGLERQGVFYNYKTTVTNVLCNGGATGAIDLVATGGRPAFSYSWSNGATTQDLSNVVAGTYTVTVTDDIGCTTTVVSTITEPAALSLSTTVVDVPCNSGPTGSIDLSVTGGQSPFTYLWSNGATTQDLSNLAAGTYTVTVTDANTCTKTTSATVNSTAGQTLNTTQVNVLCNGDATGSIDLSVTGGAPPYTYAWTNAATTEDISGLTAETYTVTVTDDGGCAVTTSVTITQPPALVLSTTQVNVLCNGGSTGSIDLSVTGGVSPYTYAWTGGATTQDLSGLAIGTYTVTVTDANSCVSSTSVTITEPAVLALSTTQVNVLCNGAATGSVDLSVSGGTSPFSYAWTGGATTQDISGLTAGTYTVTVTDANSCVTNTSVTITEPAAIVLSSTQVNVLCNGAATGSVDLSVTGGASPYTYAWTGGATTQDISGLTAGTYTVTVTDANSCVSNTSVTITEPAAIVLSTTQVNVLCNGDATGSIDLSVTGGVSPYSYAWSNTVTTQDISGLTAGTYMVTVTDANNCVSNTSVTITEPAAIVLSSTQVNVLCNGDATGSIDLSVSGGVSPYSYAWTGGATTQDISGLTAGTYTVTVTDANNCVSNTSVTITEPAAIVLSSTQVNVLCNGDATGSIDLSVTGGVSPYSYAWTGGATTQDISGLTAGTYTVTVTDANSCVTNTSVTITEPAAIVLSSTQVNVLCNGDATGSIDLSVSGGVSPYSYAWTGGATTQDISGLTAGTYMVTVTDANSCVSNTSVTITEPAAIVLSSTQVNVLCNGDATGSIDLSVSGGVSPYSYAWTGGATTQDISGLTAGTYTVTVTDANSCVTNTSVTITEPAAIVLSSTQVNVLCNGAATGSIDLSVTGGVSPYTYAWTGGATTQDISGLTAGTYTVTVTDANSCVTNTSVTITEPAAIVLSSTQVNVLCNGDATGSIDLSVSGGVSPYSYAWTGGATTQDISGLTAGTYMVTVTDANSCVSNTSVTITEPAAIVLSSTQVNVLCNGDATGSIDLSVSGGVSPYSYAWTGGATTQDISGLTAGTYTVTVTDANSCVTNTSVTITEPAAIVLSSTQVNVLCNGAATGSIDLSVTGGVSPYTYAWTGGATTQDISGLTAGTYTVTVTDANSCVSNTSVTITEPAAIVLSSTQVNVLCNGDATGSIDLSVTGGVSPYTYAWTGGATTQDISGLTAGTYTVTLTDANSCVTNTSVTITEPAAIVLNSTQVNVLCNGAATGSIDLTVTGGVSPYSYAWTGGATTQDISGLTAGTYTVTVTDANSCVTNTSVTITEPAAIVLSSTQVNVLCNGDATGSIDLSVTGGVSPYSYAWTGGATTQDISGLTAGTYAVTVTDANNCVTNTSVTITEPAAIVLSSTQVNVLCNGDATGSIDLSVTGGVSPYSYAWTGGATMQDISGLTAGTYTVTVTDANSCVTNTSVTITEPAAIVLSSTQVNVLCNGDATGSIDLSVTGGVSPYSYAWTGGATTQDISGLTAGTYTVTVTDANSCVTNTSVTITEPAAIVLSSTQVNVLCNGAATGSIDLTVTGGVSPYSYAWTGGATTQDISGLTAGTYTVTVTDANNCVSNTSVTITEPAAIVLSSTQVNVLCNGAATGSIDLSVTGGVSPYSYAWTGGATTQDISGLTAGTYTVTVTDANSCVTNTSVTITEPAAIVLSSTQVNVLCNGDATGSIDLSVSGGVSPYTYAWSNTATTQDISNLSAGTYTVTVTDANSCVSNTSVTITEPAAIVLSTTQVNVLCNGDATGSVDLSVMGGVSPYTYAWSNTATTQDISDLAAGTYMVTVTDANNCVSNTSVTITESTAIVLSTTTINATCGDPNGSIDLTVSGGTPSYTYLWSNGATTQDINTLMAGTYTVTVTDANNCEQTISANIINELGPTLSTTQVNVLCNGAATGSIDLTVTGGDAPFTYLWSNAATTQDISNLLAGTYTVSVTDGNNCMSMISATITEPAAMVLSTTQVNVLCNGDATGSIDLSVTGGVSPYSYAWSNTVTTQDISGLTAGTYMVTVTDANNCVSNTSVTITEPAAIVLSSTQVNVLCNGAATGSIDLSVTGGVSPYTYAWTGGATTQDISGLTAGTYTVTVTDANSCVSNTSVTITEPAAIVLSSTQVNVLCNGDATGSIDLSVTGGVSPYTYAWTGGATTQDISGLTAGTYTVTLTDANSCVTNTSVTITEPAAIVLNSTQVNVLCNGAATGSIDLTVTGGVSPYSYAWTGGATTQDISGLTAGTYTVTVTDANSCVTNTSVTITEPAAIVLSSTQVNVLCNGDATGSIDLSVTGGVSPYSYAWTGGATTQDISGLTAGTYAVTVTDANNCVTNTSVTITEPAAIVLSSTQVNVLCNGDATGSIDLSVTGGVSPYSYAWTGGATMQDISGLTAGTYTVTVTDANSCVTNTSVTITEPAAIVLSSTQVNVLCNGDATGSIDLSVTGGVSPYSYAWTGGATTQDISGLTAGTYTVTVTDANSCVTNTSVTITEPAAIVLSSTQVNVLCNGAATGSIDLTVTGGVSPYSYAWTGGATTQDISGLTAGTYTVTVTDANNCVSNTSVTITEPAAIVLSSTQVNVLCNGAATGSIDLSVTGGVSPYSYAWTGGATTQDISGLTAGTYTVTVTDANSCVTNTSVTITEPAAIVLSSTQVNVLCNGDATGSIDLSVTGGVSPYSYAWTGGATTQDISGLSAGTYMVTVTDANNCVSNTSVTITEPAAIVFSSTQVNVLCNGDATGSIDLSVTGGVSPYSYAWSNTATTQDISGLTAGTYTVTVTDANNCVSNTSVTITEPAAIVLSSTQVNVLCNGDATGSIDLSVTGGVSPYSYAWTGGATTQDISGLTAGTYTVTVTDANSCVSNTNVTITEPAAIVLSSTQVNVLCNGDATGSIDLSVTGGVSPYSYAWTGGATTQDLSGLTAGTYTVTVTDANNCVSNTSVTITEPAAIVLSSTQVNVLCNGAATGSIDLSVSGGVSPYTYAWSNSATTQDISGLTAGTYTVTVTDANNCVSNTSVTITESTAIVLSTTTINATCGDPNGSIDLTVSGGTPSYTYLWSNGATTQDVNNLMAGGYTVTVTDANNCEQTISANIINELGPTLSTTQVNVLCNGAATGSIDLIVSGGVAPYIYDWSNGATTQDISNLLAGTYTVSVTDGNNCMSMISATITEPAAMVLSTTQVNVLCNGDATGSIDLSVTGGVSPYTYAWTGGATTQDLGGLTAGTYMVTVTDANNCVSNTSVTITEPAAIVLSSMQVNVLCNGDATGSIDLSVTGGVSPYSYAWTGGATTQDISGLTAGTYTVTVTDANNCVSNTSVTITEPAAIVLSSTQVNVLCNGDATGSIDLSVSGGVSPYSYAWSNSATTQDLSGLTAGTYTVTVTDANNCLSNTSVTITEPTAIVLSTTTINATCGDPNGSIDLTVSGGTPSYTYLWSNGATTQDVNNLMAGGYTVTVTDANNCEQTISANIINELGPTLSTTQVNVLCNGAATGSIDLIVSGGVAPYIYVWSNGATTQDISNLVAGTYTVSVTDDNNCMSMISATITEPAAMVLSSTQVNVLCHGDATGSVDLSVTGGVSPYSYAWTGGATTQDLSNLTAGTYTVTVTDANNCVSNTSVTITEPAAIVLSSTQVNVLCNGDATGSIDLSVTGGVSPYSYAWTGGATTQDISGLTAGTYTVTVTDANNCVTNTSVTITEPAAIVLSSTQVNVLCNGAATGSIDLSVSGGVSPYSYAWSNSATTQDLSGLTAGTYTVTVTDANNCVSNTSVTITESTAIVLSTTTINATCGDPNGSIDLTVSGGTPSYTYLWSNGATTQDVNNLMAGGYTVTVTDANNCEQTISANIINELGPTLSTTQVNVLCNGAATGSIDLIVSGGVAPYTYLWNNGATTQDISNLVAGTYTVSVTDDNNCMSMISATITEPAAMVLSTTQVNVLCHGDATGSVDLSATGGVSPYTYAWTGGATTQDVSNLIAGTYTVTVTDANNCVSTTSVTITEPDALVLTTTSVNSTCGGADGSIDLTVDGGVSPYGYAWSNGGTDEDLSNLTAGTYTVTVTDENGCVATTSVTITQPDLLVLTTVVTPSCIGGASGTIDLTVTGGTPAYTYDWSNDGPDNPDNDPQDLTGLAAGTYTVTVTDVNGCSGTVSATVNQSTVMTLSTVTTAVCTGASNGTIDLTVVGGTPAYTYDWSNDGAENPDNDPQDLNGLTAGTYTVTVTDAVGCFAITSATILEVPIPTVNAVPNQVLCANTLTAPVNFTGTPAGVVFNWTNNTPSIGLAIAGNGNIAAFNAINNTGVPVVATITVTPTYSSGGTSCNGTPITFTITVNPAPAVFVVTGGGQVCNTDLFGVPVGLSGSQVGVNYQLRLNGNATGAPVAGTGAAISFGPQLGIGTYTVLATFVNGGCTTNMGGAVTITAFNCSSAITDPCACLDNATTLTNGQFSETIKVNAPGTQIWTVTAVNGLYAASSPAPPALPVAIPVGTILTNLGAGMNMFQLIGRHVDALGYTLSISNGQGTTLTISNACSYPNPVISSDLSAAFCLFSDPVTLVGNPGDNNIVSQGFTVNGVPATAFDPAQGIGTYVIEYTVNGGVPKAFGPNDPGCIQSVSQIVNVVATPSNLSCNDLVTVSLPADCVAELSPDDILEGTYGCFDDYLVELDRTLPMGNGPWTPANLDANDIGQTYQVRVTHLVSGNKCWGNVKIEDYLPPTMVCEDFSVPCNVEDESPSYLQTILNINAAIPTVTDCQNFSLTWIDTETPQNCASGLTKIISRKWTAVDASGNSSTCLQMINFIRPTLNDVVPPPDYDDFDASSFSCEDNLPIVNGHPNPTPEWIESIGLQGHPYIFGLPDGCSINWAYHDFTIAVCDGTVKYRREWTIIDWCIGDGFTYNQIIKVSDDAGPAMDCPANLTVSTDPFSCCATVNLPDVIVEDNCSRINKISGMIVIRDQYTGNVINMVAIGGTLQDFPGNNHWDLDTLAAFGWTSCLPVGTHTVTYIAEDDCGNTSSCDFELTIGDFTPPVAACDETTTVAIGVDDPFDCYTSADGCAFAGVTWVKASTFDDGSYDNCNGVKFTIRRMEPYSACIEQLSTNPCYLNDVGDLVFSERDIAKMELDSIKFYCCEVGTTQTVILRVYQVDIQGNIASGPDGEPIFNECMIQVEVQDKLKPACVPPAQVTVNCESFDPSLWAYGKAQVADNCCLDTSKVYQGQCGLTHTANYALFDTVCNKGTITRTFRAFDCHGFSSQCTQRVIVTYEQDYFVKFPNDAIVTVCDGTGLFGEPIFFGEDCELLGVSFQDQVFTVVPDACFKIERTWTIINWCTYDPNNGCIEVPNPNPNPISNAAANLPGPTVSAPGTIAPWAPTVVKINPTDPTATNYSIFWDKNANCYKYKQVIKVIDGQAPTGTYVVPTCANQNWLTPNNSQLWNEMYWWDNSIQTHDLCEEPTDLCITGTDACSGSNINIEYLLFLDLDGDGVMESVVNSVNVGLAGLGWNNVLYNNLNTPNFGGGTPRQFDERPVPGNQKYGFSIQETVTGNTKTACVRWNTQQQQNNHIVPELPHGTHKIKWFITDGCGNNAEYEYTFTVKDCKAPTVVCLNGLSVNIMPTGMITLWASDFLQYTEDNCTPADQIKIGIRKCGTGTGFPLDANGNPITQVTFTCAELATQCVELWAIDAAGNADYCETYVLVQDNLGICAPGDHINVAGALKTELLEGVEEAMVQISGTSTLAPPYTFFDLTDSLGLYAVLNSVPLDATFTIAPEKDDNPVNGVTTYDLVLISKHILGIEPLNSPYKMIAADANKSGSITTFDIVELRKLILGIYTELPNNTSWRFVDKSFSFPNANNPFQASFPETISVANAMVNQLDKNFVGIKVGDVNNTAVANSLALAEDRTEGTAIFDVEDRAVKAGEVFEVNFKSAQALTGFQFTMTLKGLEALGVVESDRVNASNFGLVFDDKVTVSVDDAQAFSLRFRALKSGNLSEMLGVSGSITRAEAYPAITEASAGTYERLGVAFRFGGNTIAGVGFELYQNQPNPFVNKTSIGFFLPEATEATLSVMDESGRVVYQQKGQFAKGENVVLLERALLNTTGVLYYKLETASDSATRKMIQAK